MKKLFLIIALLVLLPSLFAQSDCLAYFTGQGCHDCGEMDRFTAYLGFKYPTFVVPTYEVYRDDANKALLEGYFAQYEVPLEKQGVPALFIGNMYFVGNQSTLALVENEAVRYVNGNCSSFNMSSYLGFAGSVSPVGVLETVGYTDLVAVGLKDGFTIGIVALLALFIVLITAIRSKEKMILAGVLFILGVMVINILFVLGIVGSEIIPSTLYFFTKAVGIFLVIAALAVLTHVALYPKPLLGAKQEKAVPYARFAISAIGLSLIGLVGGYISLGPRSVEVDTMQFLSTVRDMKSVLLGQAVLYSFLVVWLFIVTLVALFFIKKILEIHSVVRAKERRDDLDRWIKHHHRFLNAVVAGIALVAGIIFLVV
ncbi:hypothetical protein HYV86_02655 [Candidatus Woesearchaeota archaeon]|nr:hypothetical protein [Candidatus Woesearchaeota archaeon]